MPVNIAQQIPDQRPYVSPALRSIISRSGPSNRVKAGASSAATFSLG